MKYIVVENRKNPSINAMINSCINLNIDLEVINETNGGISYEIFSKNYVHLSTNTKEFELICFRRYFLIFNYLKNNDVKEFFLLDSDVIVFDGIKELSNSIAKLNCGFVGSYVNNVSDVYKRISPHYSYWTAGAIQDFVNYLINSYKNGASEDILIAYSEFKSRGGLGGITDMTLIYLWAKKNCWLQSSTSEYSGYIADHNMTDSSNAIKNHFVSIFGAKIIYIYKNNPVGLECGGGVVKFSLLHFQGKAKKLMTLVEKNKKFQFFFGLLLLGFLKYMRKTYVKYIRRNI